MSQPWDISIASPSGGPVRLAGKATGEPNGGSLPDPVTVPVHIEPAGDGPFLLVAPTDADLTGPMVEITPPEDFDNEGSGKTLTINYEAGVPVFSVDYKGSTQIHAPESYRSSISLTEDQSPAGITLDTGGSVIVAGQDGLLKFSVNGGVVFLPTNLPTADPHEPGQVWNSAGQLMISLG